MGMATFTVNTAADVVDGNFNQLSLREAVNRANATTAADTIVFANALEGQTLVLNQGQLVLTQDLTIDGDLNNDGSAVTIDGNHARSLVDQPGFERCRAFLDRPRARQWSGERRGWRSNSVLRQ